MTPRDYATAALKLYANSLMWFTIGCVAGATEAFVMLGKIWGRL